MIGILTKNGKIVNDPFKLRQYFDQTQKESISAISVCSICPRFCHQNNNHPHDYDILKWAALRAWVGDERVPAAFRETVPHSPGPAAQTQHDKDGHGHNHGGANCERDTIIIGWKEHFTVRNIKMQSYQYFVIHCLAPPCSQQEEDKKIQHMKRTTVDRICISTRSRQSWQVASNRVMAGLTLWPRRRWWFPDRNRTGDT